MTDFLLIHGSAHGAWCWTDLIPELDARGHAARAIDLPSHGADTTPAEHVSLARYADAIETAFSNRTVIVAHSMAGFPATLAANRSPEQVAMLIYLCAHIPIPGKSIADMRALADSQPLADAIVPSADGLTITFDPTKAVEKFYHDVPEDRAAWAVQHLCPQPLKPQTTPYPDDVAGDYPRHFIRCLDDRAIPPSYQVMRTRDWPDTMITELQTSHSPFLSDPSGLAAVLTHITES